ncbi:BadF/BadG/BcrA/BcrD ATPase family protein [Streptomyces sp. NPDC051940]|uniref:N-acetylglucosamine kinase n=1 Tax=Streptomyces sp. NPDC051940 TaxID=3155675 RepID=UPI0034352CB0
MSDGYVIGIDAGGTSLRAGLADCSGGPVLAVGTAGAGNARSVPEDVLTERLAEVVGAALAGRPGASVRAVVAGFAGAGAPGVADDPGQLAATRAVRAALDRNGVTEASVSVIGDVDVAFAGAPGTPADGLVLIAGTGAASARIAGRRLVFAADGCGWLAGDDGSGFWIAREGFRRALRALDGRGPSTALVRLLAAEFGAADLPVESLRLALVDGGLSYDPPVGLARHSRTVVRAAASGDAVARAVVDEAVDLLVGCLAALAPAPGEPLVTVGGLIGADGPLLPRLTARLTPLGLTPHPVSDGVSGAVALARLEASYGAARVSWARSSQVPSSSHAGAQLAAMRGLAAGSVSASDFALRWLAARRASLAAGERVRGALARALDSVFFALEDFPVDPSLRTAGDLTVEELRRRVVVAVAEAGG